MNQIAPSKKAAALSLFFGGVLPVVAFTIIEDQYGPVWGTIAGMFFGVGEIIFEKWKYNQVSKMTWIGNAMILILGGISIVSQDGIWFKLQPALFEGAFVLILWGSLFTNKPLLAVMAEKQGTKIEPAIYPLLKGMTFRLGLFFAFHTVLATWAALKWSTTSWALLKGIGLMGSFFIYLIAEIIWIRLRIKKKPDFLKKSQGSQKNLS